MLFRIIKRFPDTKRERLRRKRAVQNTRNFQKRDGVNRLLSFTGVYCDCSICFELLQSDLVALFDASLFKLLRAAIAALFLSPAANRPSCATAKQRPPCALTLH
jgi:hypothetical protein